MLALSTELCSVVAPHGEHVVKWLAEVQDPAVYGEALQHSGELPHLGRMPSQELTRLAEAACLQLATRM